MKDYMKPEVTMINFTSEVITGDPGDDRGNESWGGNVEVD